MTGPSFALLCAFQRSPGTSPRRQPVSARKRAAAMGCGPNLPVFGIARRPQRLVFVITLPMFAFLIGKANDAAHRVSERMPCLTAQVNSAPSNPNVRSPCPYRRGRLPGRPFASWFPDDLSSNRVSKGFLAKRAKAPGDPRFQLVTVAV